MGRINFVREVFVAGAFWVHTYKVKTSANVLFLRCKQ